MELFSKPRLVSENPLTRPRVEFLAGGLVPAKNPPRAESKSTNGKNN